MFKNPKRKGIKRVTIQQEKILIVAPAWVGDAVMSLALIHRLRQQSPQTSITVLAVAWCTAVYKMCDDVNTVIPFYVGHGVLDLKTRWQYAKQLGAEKFDRAYILPNSWKSALIPFLARIPKRIGFLGEGRWGLLTEWHKKPAYPLLVDRYQSLTGGETPFMRPHLSIKPNFDYQKSLLDRLQATVDAPILAFCPGAEYGPAKRWPTTSYAKVAKHFIEQGWQIWLFGSPKDIPVAAEITENIKGQGIVNWVGHTTLEEAIYLLSLAKVALTNDSGLMHVACALKVPTVALFGSSTPAYTPPLSDKASILYLHVECSPCFKRVCPLPAPKHMQCLEGISPEQVIQEIEEKMELI